MANVAGTSAQTVSDQMTAVWNNFYDGSKSLEYYSDVMVKLGAATASSTDEISEGVNKFAATAKTVGLSYEYATAALATVTATTRESADTVGNAFKTLFSRIQGLNLGETLDDGTTLNKYSKALQSVGISIKDQGGQLKEMDQILDEMGDKWSTLGEAEKMALAQTVGGARQYTQLVALMNEWDYFKENLDVAYNSEGALEEQVKTYEESWPAASKRVEASLQGVYQSLLDDKFFISLNNGFANALGGLEAFIEGAGGVKTVLTGISSILISSFANKIPDALKIAKYNIDILKNGSSEAYKSLQAEMAKITNDAFTNNDIDPNSSMGFAVKSYNELFAAKNRLAEVTDQMSAADRQEAEVLIALAERQQKEAVAIREKNEQLRESISLAKQEIETGSVSGAHLGQGNKLQTQHARLSNKGEKDTANNGLNVYDYAAISLKNFSETYRIESEKVKQQNDKLGKELFSIFQSETFDKTKPIEIYQYLGKSITTVYEKMAASVEESKAVLDDDAIWDNILEQVHALETMMPEAIAQASNLDSVFDSIGYAKDKTERYNAIQNLRDALANCTIEGEELQNILAKLYPESFKKWIEYTKQLQQGLKKDEEAANDFAASINRINPKPTITGIEALVKAGAGLGNIVTMANSVTSAIDNIFGENDLSGWEKFSSFLTSIIAIGPSYLSLLNNMSTVTEKLSGVVEKAAKAKNADLFSKVFTADDIKSMGADLAKNAFNSFGQNGSTDYFNILTKTGSTKNVTSGNVDNLKKQIASVFQLNEAEQTELNTKLELSKLQQMDHRQRKPYIASIIEEIAMKKANAVATENEAQKEIILAAAKKKAAAATKWATGIIAVAMVAYSIYSKKVQENIELHQKEAEQAKETADASREKIEANEELISSYSELLSTLQDVQNEYELGTASADELAEAQDNLADKAREVVQALGIQSGYLDILREDWDALSDKIAEVQSQAIADALDNENDALDAQGLVLKDVFKNKTGYQVGKGYVASKSSALSSDTHMTEYDDSGNQYLQIRTQDQGKSVTGVFALGIDNIDDPEQLLGAYKEVEQFIEWANKTYSKEEATNDPILKYAKQWLYEKQEAIEAYREIQENIEDYEVQKAALEEHGGIKRAAAVTTQEEYENYASSMIKDIANERGITEEANPEEYEKLTKAVYAYLGSLEALSDFEAKRATRQAIGDTYGKDLVDKVQGFVQEYNLSEEETAILFSLEFDVYKTEEQWKTALNYIKAKAEGEEIEVTLDLIAQGQELAGDADTTNSQWVDWAGSMFEQVGEGELSSIFNQLTGDTLALEGEIYDKEVQFVAALLALSSEKREQFLSQLNNDYTDKSKENREQQIAEAEEARDALQNDLQNKQQLLHDNINNASNISELRANEDIPKIQEEINALETQIKNYNTEIDNLNQEKVIDETLGWRDALQEQAEALDINYDEVQDYANVIASTEGFAQYVDEINEALKKAEKPTKTAAQVAEEYALAYKKVEKGVKTAQDSLDDWKKAIKNSSKDITQYLKTVEEIKDVYKQVFNSIDSDVIDNLSDEFLTSAKTMSLMEKALNGSEQDWNNWEAAVAAEINTVISKMPKMSETLKAQMDELTAAAANLDFSGLNPGADIQDDAFYSKLDSMIFATADAAQLMSDNLSSMGVDAEVKEYTYEVPESYDAATQKGSIIAIAADGSTITVPVEAQVEQMEPGKKYTYYALQGAKYNGRGVRPTSAAPKTSGGGGGGSKPKHAEKKNDSDKERYHTLTNQLEDISAEYDDISEAAERAFGKDKLKNLDAQIKKTDELIDKQEEYLDAIEANLPVDKAVMDAYYQDTIGGPAIEYDERGNIANYDAIQDAMFAKYNQMADAYDEDSTEWQVFEKKYEQLEKYIEQYEETYDLLRDQEQEYQDLLNQRIDLQLEKVQYTVELKLNVSEDQVKLIEYQLGKVEDDGFKSLEAIGLLTAKANELNNQIQINKQGLNEALGLTLSLQEIQQVIAGNMSVLNGKNFTEDQIDAVKEYRDNLLDLNEEFDDIRENIEDKMMETFDAWNEKLETGIDLLDHYSSILESYQNIVDIVGQDTMGLSEEFMANLSQGQVDNAIDKVEATKKAYESLEQARAAAEDKLNEARANGDAASQEMWEKTLEELTEHSQEAQENMLSAWEDALSSIADQFELTVERVVKNFNDAVYSLGGLEGLADDFSKQQERADIMLDDYQKIYELSKLSRDINNSIDDTDLIGGKQKLKKLLGEVNALQEDGVEMSQYDLEYLQKTYDLRLAELELEEAQRAKNTVRLSKDNEGNWSYVYTQNTDAVDAAQQKYEDALYAMQDLSSNYIDEMSEKLIETSQEMAEALAELRVEDFASIDEYYAEVDRVQKYYQEQMDFQEGELNKAIANNKILYDEDWTAYHNATGYKISDTEDFVTAFKDSMLGTLMNSNSDVANFNDLIAGSVDGLTQGLLQAADTYYRNLEDAMNAAGTSTETFGQDIGEQIDQVVAKSDEGAAAVEDMADRMNAAINETMDAITTWQQSYGLAMEQIIQSNLDVIESFNEMLATLSGVGEGVTISYDIAKNGSTTAKPERFASGGYTGNWGSSGKLGILDEKELILNQNDTANMLSMLQLTHELLNMIDLQTQTAKLGFGDLVASTIKDSQKEILEQKVEITAEFPNVTDHNEIEEALMNLTNTASQYANRK